MSWIFMRTEKVMRFEQFNDFAKIHGFARHFPQNETYNYSTPNKSPYTFIIVDFPTFF